jgi:protein-tyrosine phosphatase
MSVHAIHGLAVRGISVEPATRFPQQLSEHELQRSDLIIALNEDEHRPLLPQRYPLWADRVKYWHIDDLDRSTPDDALARVDQNVKSLVRRLWRNGYGP